MALINNTFVYPLAKRFIDNKRAIFEIRYATLGQPPARCVSCYEISLIGVGMDPER